MAAPTDIELLDAWAAGDQTSGSELLKRHFDPLYRFFCNKLEKDADDLIQNTMLSCVRSRDRFRREGTFRAFLFAVARNELLHHLRSRRRDRLVLDPDVSSVVDCGESPTSMLAAKSEQKLLLLALRRLPINVQTLLELHYWEDLSTRELGEVLELPHGTVKSRLRRARALLQERVTELAESPAALQSTLDNLEHWARSVRGELAQASG